MIVKSLFVSSELNYKYYIIFPASPFTWFWFYLVESRVGIVNRSETRILDLIELN